MEDADTIAGLIKRVLVTTVQVPILKQVVDQPDMFFEFKPQATFTDGNDLVTGIEIDAERVTLMHGRFSGFNNLAGDEAIRLTANAKNCLIFGVRFFGNNVNINDLGVGNVIVNNIVEVA